MRRGLRLRHLPCLCRRWLVRKAQAAVTGRDRHARHGAGSRAQFAPVLPDPDQRIDGRHHGDARTGIGIPHADLIEPSLCYNIRYNIGDGMTISLKITQIGNSLGVILPKEALAALKVEKGDTLLLTPAPGGFRVRAGDPAFEERMEIARKIMKRRRSALRELAK